MEDCRERSLDENADRITVTYPTTAGAHTRSNLETDSYRRYLRTSKAGTATVGDEWEEFVSGGCGSTTDLVLRIEAVKGGDRIGEETDIAFEPRSETDE